MLQWHSVPTHRRRWPPDGFIRPCLPIVDGQIPTGPEWIHERGNDFAQSFALRDQSRAGPVPRICYSHANTLPE
jgi:hypothetical protein